MSKIINKEMSLVLKNWIRFFSNGFKFEHFTKRLYEYLHLHCSFIAHFDRKGFYSHFFDKPINNKRFLEQFDEKFDCKSIELFGTSWIECGEYTELNSLLVKEIKPYLKKIYSDLRFKHETYVLNQIINLQDTIKKL